MKKILLSLLTLMAISVNATVTISDVRETYLKTVKVSGKYHMGMQLEGKHDFSSLYVQIPQNEQETLCIQLTSIDGKYKANLTQKLAKGVQGLTQINFKSKYEDEIAHLKANELAVLATLGQECSSAKNRKLLVSWSDETTGLSPIVLIRSGVRIDEVNIPDIANAKHTFKCKKFKGDKVVSFDKYCVLAGVSTEQLTNMEIRRKNFAEMPSKSVEVSL